MNNPCSTYDTLGNVFPFPILGHADFLFKSVLSAMGFVGHHHNVFPERQRLGRFFKFLHGGEYNSVCFTPGQQSLQVFAAFGLYGHLAQEILTLGKLSIELVVQIVAVCNYHDGRLGEFTLQQVSVEHHGKRFSAALRMPEHSNLTIILYGDFRTLNGFLYCKILMISSKNFCGSCFVFREADKVLDNI